MAFPPPHSLPSSSYYPSLDEFNLPLYTPNPSLDLFLPPPPPNASSAVNHFPPPPQYPSSTVANFPPPPPPPPYPSFAENVFPFKSNAAAIQANHFASYEVDDGIIDIDDDILPQDLAGIDTNYFPSPKFDFNFVFDLPFLDDHVPVNGDWGLLNRLNLPPGVKFRPTDEELITHYLKRQVYGGPGPFGFDQGQPDPVTHVDVYDYEPEELKGMGQDHGDGKRYFYTHIKKMAKQLDPKKIQKSKHNIERTIKSKKGNWRPTQRATEIMGENGIIIGYKTPLAYYEKRIKSQWLMQEFKLKSYPDSHHSSHQLVLAVVYYHDRKKRGENNDNRKRKKDEDDKN